MKKKLTDETVVGVINKYGELVSYPPLDIKYTKVVVDVIET